MSTTSSETPAATPPPPLPGEGQLRRVLGVPSLVLFGLVYMVPLTVFTTYGIVTELTGGRLSVAYLVTLAALVFTARSYARMAAAYPVAGSTYAYTQRTFGAPIGFLAGWSTWPSHRPSSTGRPARRRADRRRATRCPAAIG